MIAVDDVVRSREGSAPAVVRRTPTRAHVLCLVLIAAVGLLRGGYWAYTTLIWNPVDEMQHFGYVESLATGQGIPVVGEDKVSDAVLRAAKASPVREFRSLPVSADADDPNWGPAREQYEGIQGPPYYALMVVPYWLGDAIGGVLAQLFAVRLASVVLSLLAVPLLYLLGRELFPKWPAAWLLAPAVLVFVNGFNANLASVSNDSLLLVVSLAGLLTAVRAVRRPGLRSAALAGGLFGLAVVTKSTAVGMIPIIAVIVVGSAVSRRRRLVEWALFVALYGVAAAVVVAPWVAFNLATYGALSGAEAAEAITGSYQPLVPPTLAGLRHQILFARLGFWETALSLSPLTYGPVLERSVLGAVGVMLLAWRRRTARDLGWTLWLVATLPLAFLSMMAIVYGIFGGSGSLAGRHLYVALGPLCLALAAAVVAALGSRWATVAVLVVLALAAGGEREVTRTWLDDTYLADLVVAGTAPVVDQSLADVYVPAVEIEVTPPCPAHAVGVGIGEGGGPDMATVERAVGTPTEVSAVARSDLFTTYLLPAPTTAAFRLRFAAPVLLGKAAVDRTPAASLVDGGDPLVRIYCAHDDVEGRRFSQLFDPLRPDAPRWFVYGWTSAWMWLLRALVAVAAVRAAFSEWSDRRAPRSSTRTS